MHIGILIKPILGNGQKRSEQRFTSKRPLIFNPSQCRQLAAPDHLHQHCLCLIIGMVRGQKKISLMCMHRLGKKTVAHCPRGILNPGLRMFFDRPVSDCQL